MRSQETLQFINFPEKLLPAFAPLSRSMVDHLIKIELQPYRRRSERPTPEEILSSLLERVKSARDDVFEYMDTSIRADISRTRKKAQVKDQASPTENHEIASSFPSDEWILEMLSSYTPENIRNSQKSLEMWQAKNILRKRHPRGRWRRGAVASLLIMRMVNDTHQRRWLPESIPEDEPRWWCYGLDAPDASMRAIPLYGDSDKPQLLWTRWLGAAWSQKRKRYGDLVACWSRPFTSADDVALWNTDYAEEIRAVEQRGVERMALELKFTQSLRLLSSEEMREATVAAIEQAIQNIRSKMLRKAERLILEEQALSVKEHEDV